MGKEEIARNEQFLLYPQFFLHKQKIISPFVNIFDIVSLLAAELEEPKIGMSGKGSTVSYKLNTVALKIKALSIYTKSCCHESNIYFALPWAATFATAA